MFEFIYFRIAHRDALVLVNRVSAYQNPRGNRCSANEQNPDHK